MTKFSNCSLVLEGVSSQHPKRAEIQLHRNRVQATRLIEARPLDQSMLRKSPSRSFFVAVFFLLQQLLRIKRALLPRCFWLLRLLQSDFARSPATSVEAISWPESSPASGLLHPHPPFPSPSGELPPRKAPALHPPHLVRLSMFALGKKAPIIDRSGFRTFHAPTLTSSWPIPSGTFL